LIVLVAFAVITAVALVGVRAMTGRQLDDDLRRYDEPVRIRSARVDDVARAA
jgi:hypothetical protein